MKYLDTLAYLHLNKWQQFWYNVKVFFCSIPRRFVNMCKAIGRWFKNLGLKIADNFVDLYNTFKHGSWSTRVSYLVMGVGSFAHKQWLRGLVFLLMQAIFIVYMVLTGGHWLGLFGTLGTEESHWEMRPDAFGEEVPTFVEGHQSFKILLYGLLTIFFIIAVIYTWRLNIKQCRICDEITRSGKPVKSTKDDLKSLLDNDFHKTMLSLPVAGMTMFTVLPIIFMILVAFTNYDQDHNGYTNLFGWVGLQNFNQLLSFGEGGLQVAFGEILAWTLIWAFFATFSCYFLGMFVAIMINKKGIKIKKFWRTILVLTIAVPQFISLLYISNLFTKEGIVNGWLQQIGFIDLLHKWNWLPEEMMYIPFWENGTFAKIMVLVINIWVGIPYLMLITTGILMNIPADLYESARIDGANAFQQFSKITLPYMLFVTGPYLLNSFVSNINNFNVIYLLTAGGPDRSDWGNVNGYIAGDTTILITWLFGVTNDANDFKMASVIGILVFIVVSVLSLVVFSIMPSTRREDDFS